MNIDKQYEEQVSKYRDRMRGLKSYTGLIKDVLDSPHCESWKLLEVVLQEADKADPYGFKDCILYIERNLREIKSFMVLVFLYFLKMTRRDVYFGHVYWKSRYNQIGLDNGEIIIFKTWVSSEPTSYLVQESLYLLARTFPTMVAKEYIEFSEIELGSVIEWVTYLETPDPDRYSAACELVKMAKQTRINPRQDHDQKEHFVIKKLIEVSGQTPNASANIFLFIYPFTLMEKDITYFCHIYCDFLTDLAEDNIVNFFTTLTKSAISKQIVFLINKISQLLKNEDEYFKLRILYQKYILPILARRAKACTKVEEYVFDTCSFYVLGFLKHCDIGVEGINCLLKGVEKIKSDQIKQKWIELFSIICLRYPESREMITKSLKEQLGTAVELSPNVFKQVVDDPEVVWEVTLRSGRKHKKYLKVHSKQRGIQNSHNECYIISTVQGLQKTLYLQQLLNKHKDKIKGHLPLLDEMRILFGQVNGSRKAERVRVVYLKRKGPQVFSQSQQQEDAHQYIVELFDSMQQEMKKVPEMFEAFKKIFEITEINHRICSKCKFTSCETVEKCYTYTLPHTQILNIETEESIPDYACEKCAARNSCRMIRKLAPECNIMIVHINRFSHENGRTKKELSTQTILRNFGAYQLVGMICHIGKNVENGHYIYYGRINPKRWAQYNDKIVEEFDLSNEDEQFEREMKAEMTPYILFYEKIE